ncbi:IucA/IucC family protein [Amaricoccus sp. W119]|uniref:IucA/IucC family protein n=1 Tax=Amaricoccus sp. W119 TaxID=3391833 RepID=UPI0039A6DC6B
MSLRELPRDATRARVLRQFCEALIFEGLAVSEPAAGSGPLSGWRIGQAALRARVHMGAFDRPRMRSDRIEISTGHGWRPADCAALIEALEMEPERAAALAADLERTATLGAATALRRPAARHGLGWAALEAALDEGHPYHPCFKARSGFSDTDQARYGPEDAATFRLDWLLVSREMTETALPCPGFWAEELGAGSLAGLHAAAGTTPATHVPLPVHPWQHRGLSETELFRDWIAAGAVVPVGPAGDPYRATQSVRTLMNAADPRRAHVKTALAMRNTSSARVLDPDFVLVAPAVSDWLARVVAEDAWLAGRLHVLREYAAVSAARRTPLAGHLAAIWRESPDAIDDAPGALLPFNALALIESNGRPLIDPFVREHGLLPWLDRLIEVAVLPVWHLLVAQGIAIEAHGQNLLLRHEGGWPAALVARDFHDSLEYVPALIARPDLRPDLGLIDPVYIDAAPDRFHAMSTAEELRALVMDALFVFNLADLSDMLERCYGLPEAAFWRRLRGALDRHVARHGLASRQAVFQAFARRVAAESLLTRAIRPGRGACSHDISNAISNALAL